MLIWDWIARKAEEAMTRGLVKGAQNVGLVEATEPEEAAAEKLRLQLVGGELKTLPPPKKEGRK